MCVRTISNQRSVQAEAIFFDSREVVYDFKLLCKQTDVPQRKVL